MATSLRQTILELLAQEDEYISGQDLSDQLGVSRTSIWKHIKALREKGYEIDSVPNQGYKLIQSPHRFIPEEIIRNLKGELIGKKVHFLDEVESTNTLAKQEAMLNSEGTIFLAEAQTGGRGRLGRNWNSQPGKGIWCSVLLKPNLRPVAASQFPLITAVAIAEALHTSGVDAQIKWPNDLLIAGKKVCGILTELGAEMDKINYLVIGFGLNVKHQFSDFPEDIRSIATSLEIALSQEVDRVQILTQILYQLEKRYLQFLQEGFEPIRQLWKEHTCTLGKEIKVSQWNQPPLFGKALDLNSDGTLLLELIDGQVITVQSGEVQFSANHNGI